MNKDINVYIPLDSLFDYRQGLICKGITNEADDVPTRLVQAAELWVKYFEKSYDNRRADIFECPSLNYTQEMFKKAYEERSINDFIFYTPTNLASLLLKHIMLIEYEYEELTNIRSFNLTVNTFPYVMDDELQGQLLESLKARFRGKHDIKLVHLDDRKATPSFYRSFNYVFKYDILLNDYKPFIDNLKVEPIPDVVFFVPDVFFKNQEYITGKPLEVIEAFAYNVVNQIALRGIPHIAYDHI